jgi:uncharacterized protein (TIGR02118 family)
MIAAISLMRRRPDISLAQFQRHWLHPHGTMTAELPGTRHYVQHHPIDAPGTNAYARELAIDGMPELWFDDYDARRIAYTSPRIAECNVDSENFVGQVKRLVTTPEVVRAIGSTVGAATVLLLATGDPDTEWRDRTADRVLPLDGVTGYVRHTMLEQAAAPNSRIRELVLPIAGIAEITFGSEATMLAGVDTLVRGEPAASRTAIYRVEDHRLV